MTETKTAAGKRLILVLPHLGVGGAQRVASLIATRLTELGADVSIVTWAKTQPDFFPVHHEVQRVTLPDHSPMMNWLSRRINRSSGFDDVDEKNQPTTFSVNQGNELVDGIIVVAKYAYILVRRFLGLVISLSARWRLLGPFGYPYACLLRVIDWRVRALSRVFSTSNADVVVSFLGGTNIVTVAASMGLKHRLIISERNDPSKQRLKTPWEELRPLLYGLADVVTANSEGAVASLKSFCPESKLRYIPNPLVLGEDIDDSSRSNSILFLARLVHQKAPDIVIEAYAQFQKRAPQWSLEIAGDGAMGEILRDRVREMGLENSVTFHGTVSEPAALLRACRIFVLPSRFEGTPNALLEAMANRMACIVSDASPGPLGLIQNEVTGLVVPVDRVDALTNAMVALARNSDTRKELANAAYTKVEEFGLDRVVGTWDHILFSHDSRFVG